MTTNDPTTTASLGGSLAEAIGSYGGHEACEEQAETRAALVVFARWLRAQSDEWKAVAGRLQEPTARTIAQVREDTVTRLAFAVETELREMAR